MRDFTKSMLSFSWAMSLFGVQQVANLVNPSKTKEALDNVTDAARHEFDDMTKETFRVGDDLQRKLVDMTMGIFDFDALNPSRIVRRTFDMTRQAADAVGQSMRRTASSCNQKTAETAEQGAGWGPAGGSRAASPEQPQPRQSQQEQSAQQPRQSQGWGPMPG